MVRCTHPTATASGGRPRNAMNVRQIVSRWRERFFPKKTLGPARRGGRRPISPPPRLQDPCPRRPLWAGRTRSRGARPRHDRLRRGQDAASRTRPAIPPEAVDREQTAAADAAGRDVSEASRAAGASRPVRRDRRHLARRASGARRSSTSRTPSRRWGSGSSIREKSLLVSATRLRRVFSSWTLQPFVTSCGPTGTVDAPRRKSISTFRWCVA